MAQATHTAGPWSTDNTLNRVFGADKTKTPVCGACYSQADRNLIAAAPDLLESLKNLLDEIPAETWEALPQYIQEQAIKSIAKAEGV